MNIEQEITQTDLSGNVIAKFKSIAEASRVTGFEYSRIRYAKIYGYVTDGKYKWI